MTKVLYYPRGSMYWVWCKREICWGPSPQPFIWTPVFILMMTNLRLLQHPHVIKMEKAHCIRNIIEYWAYMEPYVIALAHVICIKFKCIATSSTFLYLREAVILRCSILRLCLHNHHIIMQTTTTSQKLLTNVSTSGLCKFSHIYAYTIHTQIIHLRRDKGHD